MKQILLGFVIGLAGGYMFALSHIAQVQEDVHGHASETQDGFVHEHVAAEAPVPSVALTLYEDAKDGWNAQITVENFRFASEYVSDEHVVGEGYAHIYVDGQKINRVYGEWYYLGALEEGDRDVSIRLSRNDGKELTHNGSVIAAHQTLHIGHEDDEHHDDTH